MAVFPTAAHLASWAGMCPGQRDSAGKHGSGKTRKGSKWLRAALVQSARSASQSEGTYLSERYRQITRRRRDAKAIIAVGHEILLATYTDPGPNTFSRLSAQRLAGQAVRRLRDLGDRVTIAPRTDAAWASVPASRLAFSEQQQFAAQRRSGSPARNVWPASHGDRKSV